MFVSNFNHLAFQFLEKFDHAEVPSITVIVGQEGLGKTTLLELLNQQNQKKNEKTIMIEALKYAAKYSFDAYCGELSRFRKHFRASKLLLFDNINLLQGKKKTIDELFYTLETIIAQEGKAVFTYESDIISFDFLGSRFASRLNSGLIIRLNKPTPSEIKHFIDYYLALIAQPDLADLVLKQNNKNLKEVKEIVHEISNYPLLDGPKC